MNMRQASASRAGDVTKAESVIPRCASFRKPLKGYIFFWSFLEAFWSFFVDFEALYVNQVMLK